MKKAQPNAENIRQIIIDLGMDEDAQKEFMQYFYLKNIANEKNMLLSFRSLLLGEIHDKQEKLYRLDFLIKELAIK